ncbi:MAG TPA: glycosyltransferase family 39 protein [Planctomycetaceae bacterium]|nr:glycosyltransferase family 39 protein [Planctomycetaceae bacterium]
MTTAFRHLCCVACFSVLLLFTNLGGPGLWDRDEPRNAGCAQEMLQRGDWVVPTFNGELRTHKPALLYWLTMVSYSAFGVSEFSARFPSAVLGMATVLLTYLIAARLFSSGVALLSSCILVSTLMFTVASRAATPDSVLIFCVTLTLALYVRFAFQRNQQDGTLTLVNGGMPSWRAAVLVYGSMGLGVLAKGPIGLVLPTAIIGMFLLLVHFAERSSQSATNAGRSWFRLGCWLPGYFLRTCWQMRPITAIVACLVVAGPWYYLVGVRTDGMWLRGFFLEHNVGRAAQAMEGHQGPFFYYPLAILAGFFPWSIFALPVLIESARRVRRPAAYEHLFAICWVVVWVGLFTCARTKLPSYITPVYPGLAMLVGSYLHAWSRRESLAAAWWPYWSMAAMAVVGVGCAVGLPIAFGILFPEERWLSVIALIPLGVAVIGFWALKRERRQWFVRLNVAGAGVLMLFAFAVIADRVSDHQRADDLVAGLNFTADGDIDLACYRVLEPSWVFYLREPIWQLGDDDQLSDGPPQDEFWSPRRATTPEKFLTMDQRHRVITTKRHWRDLQKRLPSGVAVLETIPYFMHDEDLVLIGYARASVARARDGLQR